MKRFLRWLLSDLQGQPTIFSLPVPRKDVTSALRALVNALDTHQADPRYKAVWASYYQHGGQFRGDLWGEELKAAKRVLGQNPNWVPDERFSCSGCGTGVYMFDGFASCSDGSIRALGDSNPGDKVMCQKCALPGTV